MGIVGRIMDFFGLQETREELAEGDEELFDPVAVKGPRGQVVNLHTQKSLRVCLSEPRSYDEAQEIADNLRSHRAVIVNLQRMQREQALRVIDFLGGTVYALEGSIQKLGPNIFFLAPRNVEIQGSITDAFLEVVE